MLHIKTLIRQRFLDTFRRDVLNDSSAQGAPGIALGNRAAHHGDAVIDAMLYSDGLRHDESLFFRLYGMSPRQVLGLSMYELYLRILTC